MQLTTHTSSPDNPYVFGNATQEWIDKERNVKILFSISPEYPSVEPIVRLVAFAIFRCASHIEPYR